MNEGNNFDWLKDEKEGILAEFKTARVLKFGYDSRWFGAHALKQTLVNAAEMLLVELVAARRSGGQNSDKPIIFVAHSLGGLVVAKALTMAKFHPEVLDRMRIYECFAGGIFFGTPFGGTSQAAKGVMLGSILESIKNGVNSQMVQILDPGRDSLME